MLAILNSKPIFSSTGKAVYGRFYVFQKDTNQTATIYTYDSNNSLIEAQNPVYTDNYGFPEYDVVLDDQIYSIVVEEYLGNYDDPKTDDRSEMWHVCNSYYEGFVNSGDSLNSTVYSISSLTDADISLGSIDVIGYWNSFDCEKRTYSWDSSSIESPDNGYIIRSSKSSRGRWILVNSHPYIPSEYYGVYPGNITNMGYLTACPLTVGTLNPQTTPSCIKFAPGTYTLTSTINTASKGRSILVDNNTCFGTNYSVSCKGIDVLGSVDTDDGSYIGKLVLDNNSEARYSWFPTIDSFLTCGAETLIVDSYGINNELERNIASVAKTIVFDGGKLAWTSSLGYLYTVNNCKIIGEHKAVGTTYWNGFSLNTVFTNMAYTDKYILGTGNATTITGCTIDVDDFESVSNYISAAISLGYTVFDLHDRELDSFIVSSNYKTFVFKNATIGSIGNTGAQTDLTFINCFITTMNCAAALKNLVFNNCIVGTDSNISSVDISVNFSHIQSGITATGTVYSTYSQIDGDITNTGTTSGIYNSIVNGKTDSPGLIVMNSTLNDDLYPRATVSTNSISAHISGNNISGIIRLIPIDSESQVVLNSLVVTNNEFSSSTDSGIYVQVWASGNEERFLADGVWSHRWTWKGNTGNCLKDFLETSVLLDLANAPATGLRWVSFGIPGSDGVEPYYVELVKYNAGTTAENPFYYVFNQTNYDISNWAILKYSTTDYFAHKIIAPSTNLAGTYKIKITNSSRGGN